MQRAAARAPENASAADASAGFVGVAANVARVAEAELAFYAEVFEFAPLDVPSLPMDA